MRPAATLRWILAATVLTACDRASAPIIPTALTALAPLEQTGTAGAPAEHAPAVRATTDDGRPVAGVIIRFTVTAGNGAPAANEIVTDIRGEARLAAWHLGTTAGPNALEARIGGHPTAAVTFRASGRAGPPARLRVLVEPAPVTTSGALLMPQPVVELADQHGNVAAMAGIVVTASAAGAQLEDSSAVTDSGGRAAFTWLRLYGAPGSYTLQFTAPGLVPAVAATNLTVVDEAVAGSCSAVVPLAFAPGELRRVTLDRARGLNCLDFDLARATGQQYLVMVENMPMFGSFTGSFFDAARAGQPVSPREFAFTLRSGSALAAAPRPAAAMPRPAEQHDHAWDFGGGRIYGLHPEPPPGGIPEPFIITAQGRALGIRSAAASLQVGDTIRGIWMERLPHLDIPAGLQSAVIRHISDELIIAEDVRLPTLVRPGGGINTPLHADTLAAMAREYARFARVQSDMLFDGRHNAAVENVRQGRVIAVHSIMPAANIWGYTYSSSDYFVFDYWVTTNGSVGGINQRVQRVVDNLFMHEVSHMREFGLLQRNNVTTRRANKWFVEGFARFTERLPIAARLLGTQDPSRTGNVVLPLNPIFGGAFARDDVPTYLNAVTPAFSGYQHSSFVFDYFADQVTLAGGDWRAALREFAVAAGRPDAIDAITIRWTGATLPELFTRARVALILDDMYALPPWTQYHQFQLRASRPPASAIDPRDAFPRLVPGESVDISHALAAGAAWGYIIDGTRATASARFILTGPATANAVLSVTRIR
jgi:hypothetical protein